MSDFTVADVLAWARTKPADEKYDYSNPFNCALCHFLRDTGRSAEPLVKPYAVDVVGGWWTFGDGQHDYAPYPAELEPALHHGGTFGGLVAILETIAPKTPVTQSDWAAIDTYLTDIEQVSA